MNQTPQLISVVIAALNVRDVIDVQLTALAKQDYEGDFEVVVGDNGSSDGLHDHLKSHPLRDRLRLQWVDASDQTGVSHARNIAVAASHGDFIAFCDADDQVHTGWLRLLAAEARNSDAVGGGLDGATLSSARAVSWRPLSDIDEQPRTTNARLPWVGGGNMGIWRSVFNAVGGWDETYRYALEDMALSWRVQLSGYTLGWCPEAIVSYRLRDDLGSLRRQSYNYGRGEVQLYRDFRGSCMSGRPPLLTAALIVLMILRNPLLPTTVTKLPRGQWLWHVASLFGRIRGSVEFRTFYV